MKAFYPDEWFLFANGFLDALIRLSPIEKERGEGEGDCGAVIPDGGFRRGG
jgi:hypothetical protein